jgi:WXG100 family type VII secretion target
MAGSTKKIPPTVAREVAGKCKQSREQLNQIMTEILNRLNSFEGRWRGEAQAQYMANYGQRVTKLQQSLTLLDQIAAALEKVAKAAEDAEEAGKKIAARVGG